MWCILFVLLYHPSLQTVSFLSLQYYWLKYRCNECQTYRYKQMYRLSTTSIRISVSRGKRWTVMLRVHTRSGDGEWAKATVDACSLVVMRPVTDLEARLDAHNRTLVSHLTWKAPHDIRNLQVKKKKTPTPTTENEKPCNERKLNMYSVKEKRLPQLVAIVRLSWKPYHKLTPPFISSSGTVTYPLRLSAFSMHMAGNSLLFFYYKVVLTSTVELARYTWEGPRDWY